MLANTAKLVDQGKSTEDCEVSYINMSREARTIGKYNVIPEDTVVGNMRVRHNKIIVANPGEFEMARGPPVYRAIFPYGIAITYFQPRGFASIALMLGCFSDGTKLENPVGFSYGCIAPYNNMGTDPGTCANNNITFDDGKWSYRDVFANYR